MAKPHIRLTLDLIDMTVANNVKIWLESKLSIVGMDKNNGWENDGNVLLFEPNWDNELEFPRITFFANLNHIDRQGEFRALLIDKIRSGAMDGKVKYVMFERWICSHDEDIPEECAPIISYEEVF